MSEKKVTKIIVIPPIAEADAGVKPKRRVAAYCRVSTLSEEQETSLIAQQDYYYKYILGREDWEFVNIYYDDGISGLSFHNREGFSRMVEDALAGQIDLIITKSLSRFARNTVDTLVIIRKLKAKNVEVYFEKEDIYTLDSKGEFLITLMSSLAQEESRSMSENITWGQRKRFADGIYHMPYSNFLGYDKGPNGTPVINQEQAKVVRLIYLKFLLGETAYSIGKYLDDQGIQTPMGVDKWSASTMNSILTNEKYKGDALLQKSFTVDFLTKKKKVNHGEIPQYYVENSHEAIVSALEFDMVQGEIARRQKLSQTYSGNSIFSSKLICGDCGGFYGQKVWHSNDSYRKVVWRCNRKFTNSERCSTPTLSAEIIQRMYLKAYNQLMGSRDELIASCEVMRQTVADCDALNAEIDALNEEIQVVAEMVNQCVQENATKKQSQDEYLAKYNRLARRYEKAVAKLNADTEERNSKLQRERELRIFIAELAKQPLVVSEWNEELWISLLDTATVHKDKNITFRFRDGTEIMVSSE